MPQPVYRAHEHRFTVDGGPLTDRIGTVLATLRVDSAQPLGNYTVRETSGAFEVGWNGEAIGTRGMEDSALLLLHWHINQQAIASSTERRTTFHAAAARSPAGNGILLAAPMEAGKTTTVTGLLRSGWDYLSDEAVGVDPDGTMWGYPKPLTIDKGSWPLFPDLQPPDVGQGALSWLVPATTAGATPVGTARLRLLVFPAYDPGTDTALSDMSASQAALALAHSAFEFDERGERDLRVVSALARETPAYRLAIADLDAAVELLNGLDKALGDAA